MDPSSKTFTEGRVPAVRCRHAGCEVAGHNWSPMYIGRLRWARPTRERSSVATIPMPRKSLIDIWYRTTLLTIASDMNPRGRQRCPCGGSFLWAHDVGEPQRQRKRPPW